MEFLLFEGGGGIILQLFLLLYRKIFPNLEGPGPIGSTLLTTSALLVSLRSNHHVTNQIYQPFIGNGGLSKYSSLF